MRYSFVTALALALPLMAMAQGYSTAPMIVDTTAPRAAAPASAPPANAARTAASNATPGVWTPDFPETAVTRIGENSTGQQVDMPANPPNPATPTAPDAPTPDTPAAPASPPSPISKLWPRDTVPIFLQSCTGFHPELIDPCTCVITQLMSQMGHDEFLQLSESDAIEHDPRLINARQQCIPGPKHKD
jgi:hypothetical protein